MSVMVTQIFSLTIVCSNFYWGADQRKYQSSVSLAFVRGIRRWSVNSLHKRPVTRKMFPFDDVIMQSTVRAIIIHLSHCYHIFLWLCAWDVCYIIFCHLLHISSEETVNLFSLLLCSLWWVQIFGYVLACRSYSFVCTVHHLIITIVQTNLKGLNLWNACQIYIVECVSKIEYIPPLSIIQYVGLYVFSLSISLVIIERIYIYIYFVLLSSSNRKYELLPIV